MARAGWLALQGAATGRCDHCIFSTNRMLLWLPFPFIGRRPPQLSFDEEFHHAY